MANLSKEIIQLLAKKLHKTEGTIRVEISKLKSSKFHNATPNAVAHIYARQHGQTVWQKLSKEDKQSIPNHEVTSSPAKVTKKSIRKIEKDIELIKYDTDDHFRKGHIKEINRAYTSKAYTSTFIFARKIIENFIIDILLKQFPSKTKENKELYYDTSKGRYKDFSVILENLYAKRNDFAVEKIEIVKKLYIQAKALKENANDKTHSWYHLVETKKEIDDLGIQTIIELIKKLEK